MKAIIYCRVSTKEQAKSGFSLEHQEATCKRYAESNRFEVTELFIEKGESAKSTDRTQLQSLFEYIVKNKKILDAVIVYRFDQLSRNMEDMLQIKNSLARFQISVLSATETNKDTAVGKLTRNIFSSFAQFENDINSERTLNGMKQALREGRWIVGRPPIGYTQVRDEKMKTVIIQTDDAPWIKKALELFASGKHTQTKIITILKKEGYKKLTLKNFNKIVRHPLYAGYIHRPQWDIHWLEGIHIPIISKETFHQIQDILDGRSNSWSTKSRSLKMNDDFPLRGVIRCEDCDYVLTGSFSRSKTKRRYAYYHGFKKCNLHIPKDRLEEQFIDLLNKLQPDTGKLDEFFTLLVSEWNKEQHDQLLLKKKMIQDIKRQQERKAKIEELAINGTFEKDTYKRLYEEVTGIISKLEVDIERLDHNEKTDLEGLITYAREVLDNIADFWQDAPFFLKKEFELTLFPEGLQYIKKEGFRTPVTSLYTIKKTTLLPEWSTSSSPRGIEPRLPG